MRTRLAVGMAVALIAAACGDGSSGTPGTGDLEPAESTAGPTTLPAPPDSATSDRAPARAPVDAGAPTRRLAAGFNDAGFDLLRQQSVEENVVFSPSSVGHAMLMAGAAGDEATAAAIEKALGLPPGAHDAWNAIDQRIGASQRKHVEVAVADRIWPDAGALPDQDWLDLLARKHGASNEPLELQGDPEASRQRINDWVEEQTEGLIPELMPEGSINPNTVLVLTDALYFKARWETVFGKYGPIDAPFTRLDGSTVDVELMQQLELTDPHGSGDGFVGAEIPYLGGDFSMLVLVPDEGRFAEVRDRLDQSMLDEIDATFTTGAYELRLPSWKTTTQIDLLGWLTELGAAPGRYPAISPDAFLSAAVHGADISVDEWGTVAAAATGLGFDESGAMPPDFVVTADQPFLYLIRHGESGLVLFAGQVTDPTA